MKKDNQYVGVEDKYIPEDEKNVNNDLNKEIKEDANKIYNGAKDYISNKDNQKNFKKVAKGIGIGYLILIGIVTILAIFILVFAFSQVFKINKQNDEIRDKATNIINQGINNIDKESNKMKVEEFNSDIEVYTGTQYGLVVSNLLDNVIKKIQKNADHSIIVKYGTIVTSKVDEITALKKQLDKAIQYEVSLDYDSNGYINKIMIENY